MKLLRTVLQGLTFLLLAASQAHAADRPNILVIMSDDVGPWDISAYHRGLLGGSTPNIDRLAKEGMIFMDHYSQASCTAGRAAFITGQYPIRTGLSTVGLPGARIGLQKEDPTLAELLKPLGYATGQFGKNHLGDRDEYLPTAHGFDEFFGILYHLNAGEQTENYDYPTDPEFLKRYKMRGVTHSWALPDGTQKIVDKGSFGAERQRTLDEEVLKESKRFMREATKAGKPFFLWHNTTHMHYKTNLSKKWENKSGYGVFADGMMELDDHVGQLLDLLAELKVADNTLVLFTSDNGPAMYNWPDGGTTPFAGEKGLGMEGGFRVPMLVRWPGKVPAGVSTGEFMTMEDWLPTIMAMVGQPTIGQELLQGKAIGERRYKVHLDGVDQTDLLTKNGKTKRTEFFYFTENKLHAVRIGDYKFRFVEQERWAGTRENLVTPNIVNLKIDPFERKIHSRGYPQWQWDRTYLFLPVADALRRFAGSFKEFPARQKSFDLNVDAIMQPILDQAGQSAGAIEPKR